MFGRITLHYAMQVSTWDFEWGQQGRVSARANNIGFDEVVQALESPTRLEIVVEDGPGVFVIGLADSGRLVFVVCDRVKYTRIAEITSARLASVYETRVWQERNHD